MDNEKTYQPNTQDYSPPQYSYQSFPAAQKTENAFKPDIVDFVFALAAFLLGYLFSRWVLFTWLGFGVSIFTTAYLLAVTGYLVKKGVFTKSFSTWFWLAVTFITGASYAIWDNVGLYPIRALLLFGSAILYVISASGCNAPGKTDSSPFIDGLNALIIVPFRNFMNQYVSFKVLSKRGKLLHILLGTAISLILAAILIPLLERADSGGFGVILNFFRNLFTVDIGIFIFYSMFAIPVATFMYGLTSGSAHKKGTDIIKQESMKNAARAMRVLQPATVFVMLGVTCVLYLVFIFSQLPYFFSAFTGTTPDGWLIYSEYARQGFFELCAISAINLALLAVGNTMCKKQRTESKLLHAFNVTLSIITLVLIATAFSKMVLYVHVFGLTMLRLLPCVFMLFLAVVFTAIIVRRFTSGKKEFSIIRLSLIVGAVMLCVLNLANPDAIVVRYNADRYLGGTLREFDTEIVFRADHAGIIPAITVYENTQDAELREEIRALLETFWNVHNNSPRPIHATGLESHLAMQSLDSMFGGD